MSLVMFGIEPNLAADLPNTDENLLANIDQSLRSESPARQLMASGGDASRGGERRRCFAGRGAAALLRGVGGGGDAWRGWERRCFAGLGAAATLRGVGV